MHLEIFKKILIKQLVYLGVDLSFHRPQGREMALQDHLLILNLNFHFWTNLHLADQISGKAEKLSKTMK